MTDFDQAPDNSPLTQSVTRDGKTVQINIYGNGEGGWLLEIGDEYGNSTVWDAVFESDHEALNEAFKTIDETGIDVLIGQPFNKQEARALDHALSDDELDELDDFLALEPIDEMSMDVATLDGFLTAIAISPQMVLPSES